MITILRLFKSRHLDAFRGYAYVPKFKQNFIRGHRLSAIDTAVYFSGGSGDLIFSLVTDAYSAFIPYFGRIRRYEFNMVYERWLFTGYELTGAVLNLTDSWQERKQTSQWKQFQPATVRSTSL